MIFEINQTTTNGVNNFEIIEYGRVLYKATTPFINPIAPVAGDSLRKLSLTDFSGNITFTTYYDTFENTKQSALPLSYLFTGSKKVSHYKVVDNFGNTCGAFYIEQSDLMNRKMVIEYQGKLINCYKRSVGDREVVSFYQEETQIGQLTKTNCIVNNIDVYFVHFMEEYRNLLPIISFFVIYYDFRYHNNSGEYISKGYSVHKTYTYDKNSKKYNKDFIRNNFGEAEERRISAYIKQLYSDVRVKSGFNLKKFWLTFGIGWGVAIIIALIILLIVLFAK